MIHDFADPRRGGSFGQVATASDDPLSLWDKPDAVIERAVGAIRGHDTLMLPLDPRHLLVLSKFDHFMLPGRYDRETKSALAYDLLLLRASRRWLCRRPAAVDEACAA